MYRINVILITGVADSIELPESEFRTFDVVAWVEENHPGLGTGILTFSGEYIG